MRKIIQICAIPSGENNSNGNNPELFALCNDGTAWSTMCGVEGWRKILDIPQPQFGNCGICSENREDDYASYRLGGIKICKKCFCEELDSYYGKPK